MKILDSTCSAKSIWYQKDNPFTVFMDMRKGDFIAETDNMNKEGVRTWRVHPDILAKWQHLPFKDNSFDMVVFDPPHLICNSNNRISGMAIKYGFLYNQSWREQIRIGAAELFRALKPEGIFILKWCEKDKKIEDVLELLPYKPMFGTRTGQSNKTHWILFLKHKPMYERTLEDFMCVVRR